MQLPMSKTDLFMFENTGANFTLNFLKYILLVCIKGKNCDNSLFFLNPFDLTKYVPPN